MSKEWADIFEELAAKNGISVIEFVGKMKSAIDEMWDSTDERTIEFRQAEFPNGRPSVKEFIAYYVKKYDDTYND